MGYKTDVILRQEILMRKDGAWVRILFGWDGEERVIYKRIEDCQTLEEYNNRETME